MRIGIDARALGWAGLGRYSRNLLQNIAQASPPGLQLTVFAPRVFGRELSRYAHVRFVPVTPSYYSLREQTFFLASLLNERLDLMHFLHFNAPIFYRRPFVVTIHDLTRFFFPAQKNKGQWHQWAYEEVFRSVILNSQKIITVSEHTRGDLTRYFPQVAEKTAVIYEGVDEKNFYAQKDAAAAQHCLVKLGMPPRFLLFVGVWMTHKNLPRLLQAFQIIKRHGYPGALVITGQGRPHHVDVPQLVRGLGLTADVILPGRVSDSELTALYQAAEVLVFPSLYEGFGLPALEAMACGTLVAASRASSIPEILGDAAVYFDPYSVEDMAETIENLLAAKAEKEELIKRGLKRAENYQWQKCAQETLQVYQKAVSVVRVRQ